VERLAGKVAIVTGGAAGIGEATVRRMIAEGATVVVADINEKGAQTLASELGENASALAFDANDVESIRSMIEQTISQHGRIDVLHNNAARTDPEFMSRDTTVVDMDFDFFDEMIAVTLRSYVAGCKFVIPHMLEQGGGAIIQTSSLNGSAGHVSGTAYGMAKAGVNVLTKYVATQYGRKGIRCNAIAVGVVMTEARKAHGARLTAVAGPHVLTPRLGEPADAAAIAAFLASEDAAFVNGQLIHCDGGWLAHQPHVGDLVRQMESDSQD
jgi:NAD(P)-dependent dehydrogenase (short-subunit alcohol dehydrogenase family)